MPKQVDHDQRRREIAEAVCSLIAARGLEAVSLRDVAAAAGISMGRVQHYFGTKDEMLLFAMDHVTGLGKAWVEEHLATLPDPDSPRAVLRRIVEVQLATTPQQAQALRVGLAFQARALVEPRIAARLREGYTGLHGLFELLIRQAVGAGEVPADADPPTEAATLFALGDGLSTHLLLGHCSHDQALRALDRHLDRLFAG